MTTREIMMLYVLAASVCYAGYLISAWKPLHALLT